MFSNPVAPQSLQLSAFDCASLRKVLDQRIKHRMVVESTCGLPVNKIEHKLETVLRPLQLGFKRADTLKQVFLESRPYQTFNPSVCSRGGSARNYHQARAADDARLSVIRILMSALLTKYHCYLLTLAWTLITSPKSALEAVFKVIKLYSQTSVLIKSFARLAAEPTRIDVLL
jgi:hypothetical protein